jgi:hypothetical protein
MAKLKISQVDAAGVLYDQGQASGFGGTGGAPQTLTSSGVKTISLGYNTDSNVVITTGYIVAQKGASKFLVANSAVALGNLTVVTLANVAIGTPGLRTANQATISCFNTSNVAFNASRITTKYVYDFAGNKFPYKVNTAATTAFANVAVA